MRVSVGDNNFDTTYQFAVDAYWSVRENAENEDLMVVMHVRTPNIPFPVTQGGG